MEEEVIPGRLVPGPGSGVRSSLASKAWYVREGLVWEGLDCRLSPAYPKKTT